MADPSTSKPSSNNRNIPIITPHYPPPDPPECHDGDNSHANKKPSFLSSKLSVKPSCRVSFSETDRCYEYSPPHKSGMSRCYHRSSASSTSNRHCGCRIRGCGCCGCSRFLWCSSPSSRCCICCLWTCIILLCLFFIVAVAFALFLIYFQPRLPVFRIDRLDFSTFNITAASSSLSSQQKYILSTDIELSIVASNVNEKIDFSYSSLMVCVSSGNVTLGEGEIPGFFQLATAYSGHSNLNTPTKTVLNIRAGVSQSAVDIEEGERLRANLLETSDDNNNRKTTMMTNLDVIFSGTIKFNFRSSSSGSSVSSSSAGNEIAESEAVATPKFPVSVLCKNIDMSRVAGGDKPHCKVELFTFQVTNTPNVF